MKISADQIDKKAIAGTTKEGNPVVYIATKGGLHAFFTKDENGNIASIGAAPHRAIAKFLASKKADIAWKDDFYKSEDLEKSEEMMFERMRSALFTPELANGDPTKVYMVYHMHLTHNSIEVMTKSELEEEIKKNLVGRHTLVRDTSLTKKVSMAQDCEEFSDLFEEE